MCDSDKAEIDQSSSIRGGQGLEPHACRSHTSRGASRGPPSPSASPRSSSPRRRPSFPRRELREGRRDPRRRGSFRRPLANRRRKRRRKPTNDRARVRCRSTPARAPPAAATAPPHHARHRTASVRSPSGSPDASSSHRTRSHRGGRASAFPVATRCVATRSAPASSPVPPPSRLAPVKKNVASGGTSPRGIEPATARRVRSDFAAKGCAASSAARVGREPPISASRSSPSARPPRVRLGPARAPDRPARRTRRRSRPRSTARGKARARGAGHAARSSPPASSSSSPPTTTTPSSLLLP